MGEGSMKESDTHAHHPDERAELYTVPEGLGETEIETTELLYGLVRSFKPKLILETGTYKGLATVAMAKGCKENGFGKVVTVENWEAVIPGAKEAFQAAGVADFIELVQADSISYLHKYEGEPFDFAYLDTRLSDRVVELRMILKRGLVKGPALVHDTSRLRSLSGVDDNPEFPAQLDELILPCVENPFSRGWRLFDLRKYGGTHAEKRQRIPEGT
jgi:predicted O-methyltransferase YrrM